MLTALGSYTLPLVLDIYLGIYLVKYQVKVLRASANVTNVYSYLRFGN